MAAISRRRAGGRTRSCTKGTKRSDGQHGDGRRPQRLGGQRMHGAAVSLSSGGRRVHRHPRAVAYLQPRAVRDGPDALAPPSSQCQRARSTVSALSSTVCVGSGMNRDRQKRRVARLQRVIHGHVNGQGHAAALQLAHVVNAPYACSPAPRQRLHPACRAGKCRGMSDPCPAPFNLAAYVLAAARLTPDKIALEILRAGGAERWSFARLDAAVRGTGDGAGGAWVAAGRAGACCDWATAWISRWPFLGAMAVGLVPVPTSTALTAPEITAMAEGLTRRWSSRMDGGRCPTTPPRPDAGPLARHARPAPVRL